MWAWAAQDGRPDAVPLERATLTPLTGGACDGGGSLLVGYGPARNAVVLAVNATQDCALETAADFAPAQSDMYRNWFALASFDADRDDPLLPSLPAGATTLGLAQAAAGDAWPPAAIHVSGFAWGGGLARSAALYMAAYVPIANVRCITFGAPAGPDARFEWATEQLVDLSYTWAAEGDPTIDVQMTGAPAPAAYDPPSRRWVVNTHTSKWVSRELRYSSTYYVIALQETFLKTALWSTRGGAFDRHDNVRKHFAAKAAILANSSNATARLVELKDMLTTSVDKLKRALAGVEEHDPGSIPVAALPPDWPANCLPVLCKLRRTVVQVKGTEFLWRNGREGRTESEGWIKTVPPPPNPPLFFFPFPGQQRLLGHRRLHHRQLGHRQSVQQGHRGGGGVEPDHQNRDARVSGVGVRGRLV